MGEKIRKEEVREARRHSVYVGGTVRFGGNLRFDAVPGSSVPALHVFTHGQGSRSATPQRLGI